MAENPRQRIGPRDRPAENTPGDRESTRKLWISYGFLIRPLTHVRIDDPLGDYSEQTGAQFG